MTYQKPRAGSEPVAGFVFLGVIEMEAVKKPTTKHRSRWIMTLLKPAECERLKQRAAQEGLSMSAVVRRAVLRDLARGRGPINDYQWPENAGR